jgi:hypothetical protein
MGLLDGKKWSWVLNCPLTLGNLPYNVKHVNSVKVKYMVSFSVDTRIPTANPMGLPDRS